MPGHVYFPDPSEEPPVESRFFHSERRGEHDSPEMVHLWAKAVLTQCDRYREALLEQRRLEDYDRHGDGVHSDEFFEAWCAERADLHFLMEAAVQMYRWASTPSPSSQAWEDRTLLYELPEAASGRWVKTLRDALVHYDEAYRGGARAAKTVRAASQLAPDIRALAQAARYLLSETEGDYKP